VHLLVNPSTIGMEILCIQASRPRLTPHFHKESSSSSNFSSGSKSFGNVSEDVGFDAIILGCDDGGGEVMVPVHKRNAV